MTIYSSYIFVLSFVIEFFVIVLFFFYVAIKDNFIFILDLF